MSYEIERMAREAQNKYAREWRKKNPDKVREINRKYWVRRAQREAGEWKEDADGER